MRTNPLVESASAGSFGGVTALIGRNEPLTADIGCADLLTLQTPGAVTGEILKLSLREKQVLELLSQGLINKEIADSLSISFHTVKVHLKSIYGKLQVRSRGEAMLKFLGSQSGSAITPRASLLNLSPRLPGAAPQKIPVALR